MHTKNTRNTKMKKMAATVWFLRNFDKYVINIYEIVLEIS